MALQQSEESSKITELSYREKVPVAAMKEILRECLSEKLVNQQYEGEKCNEAAKQLADLMRNRLKSLGYDRYKYIVQVLIGERREQGVYFGTRCFWDVNTDNQASDTFTNVSLAEVTCSFPSHPKFLSLSGPYILYRNSICRLPILNQMYIRYIIEVSLFHVITSFNDDEYIHRVNVVCKISFASFSPALVTTCHLKSD
jgi:hypothetical protein